MADQYLKYGIDASAAEAGAKRFEKAVEAVRTSSRKSVRSAASDFAHLQKVLSNSDFTKTARQLRSLMSINFKAPGLTTLTRQVSELSAFKGPSRASVTRTRDLAKAIRELGRIKTGSAGKVVGDISKMGAALNAVGTFRAPTTKQIGNFREFINLMNKMKTPRNATREIGRFIIAMQGFRPPTSSQISRFREFMEALQNIRMPRGVRQIVTAIDMIGRSATRANTQMGMFRRNVMNIDTSRSVRQMNRLRGSLRGLENQFSLSYQAGTLFRAALGGLTVGGFGKGLFDTSVLILQAESALRVATGSASEAADEMERAKMMIEATGGSIEAVLPRYAKFATAATLSGLTVDESRNIFRATQTALTVLGASAQDAELAFIALEQIASKGTLSSEELRRQLGERLPGAFQIMAKALFREDFENDGPAAAVDKLNKALKRGEILGAPSLLVFAEELEKQYGPELEASLNRPDIALNRLSNTWLNFKEIAGEAGFMQAIGRTMNDLADTMRQPEFEQFAMRLGEGMGQLVSVVGNGLVWMVANADQLADTAKALLKTFVAFKAASLAGVFFRIGASLSMASMSATGLKASLIGAAGGAKALKYGLIATGIGAFIVALGTAAAWLMMNRDHMVSFGDSAATVGSIMDVVWGRVSGVMDSIGSAVGSLGINMQTLSDMAMGAGRALFGAFVGPLDFLAVGFARLWVEMQKFFDELHFKAAEAQAAFNINNYINPQAREDTFEARAAARGRIETNYQRRLAGLQNQRPVSEFLTTGFGVLGDGIGDLATGIIDEASQRDAAKLLRGRQTEDEQSTLDKLIEGSTRKRPDPLSGSGSDDKALNKALSDRQRLIDSLLTIRAAIRDYEADLKKLATAEKNGEITTEEYRKAKEQLAYATLEARDPIAAQLRTMREEREIMMATIGLSDSERDYRMEMLNFAREGVVAFGAQNEELREEIRLRDSLSRFEGLRTELDPIGAARAERDLDLRALQDAADGGILTGAKLEQAQKRVNRKYQDALDPVGGLVRKYEELGIQAGMNETQARRYSKVREELNALEAAGVVITRDLTMKVTELVSVQDQLENPQGFQKWIDGARELNEVMSDLAQTVGNELSASFAELFKTGNFPVQDFLEAIRDEAAQGAGDLLTKDIFETVGLGSKGGLIGGAKAGLAALFDGKDGNFFSAFSSGFNEINKANLTPGDRAIVTVLEQIRDGQDSMFGDTSAADMFNNGGIFGDLVKGGSGIVSSLFGGGSGGGIGSMFSGLVGGEGSGPMDGLLKGGLTAAGAGIGAMFGMPALGAQVGGSLSGLFGGLFGGGDSDPAKAMKLSSDPVVAAIQQQTQIMVQIAQQQQQSSGGGLGGLASLTGGGGSSGDIFSGIMGLFGSASKGGIVGSFVETAAASVSSFRNAPHYATGTANTSSGGRPAILHDEEAVIPLSGGRAVPVKMMGGESGGTSVTQQISFNINANNPNEFGRSEAQMKARFAREAAAVARRRQ